MRYDVHMRTTVTLDVELVQEAKRLTGLEERSALLRAALLALIQREAARRLALLGGSQPEIEDVPRRRPAP
jgi:Arc/MetJ family transcription regulator